MGLYALNYEPGYVKSDLTREKLTPRKMKEILLTRLQTSGSGQSPLDISIVEIQTFMQTQKKIHDEPTSE